jgi:predicted MPP superfamily phosphohydrolase
MFAAIGLWRRGRFVLAVIGSVAAAGAAGLVLYAFEAAPNELVVRTTKLALPHWPRTPRPLRVAAISDIHAGSPFVDEARLREIVRRTNARSPDIVVLLGDYVVYRTPGVRSLPPEKIAGVLKGLRTRAGVYAVLGNHDAWYGAARVRRALRSVGFTVLENRAADFSWAGRHVWVAGIADALTRHPDPARALARVPAGEPVLAITHNPNAFRRVPARVALTIAGHTHGGQVRLPLAGCVYASADRRFCRGHVVEGGRHLFVTTGIGTSILPARLGVPPEIRILELRAAGR